MSKLAFTSEGEPIDVPPSAVAWQVRRPQPKGSPQVVYGADGLPLFLPIDAGIEDLRRAVELDGRYQLVAVDEHHHRIDGTPSAWAYLRSDNAVESGRLARLSVRQVHHVARTNTDVAQLLIAQAAILLDAAGTLLGTSEDTDLLATAIRALIK